MIEDGLFATSPSRELRVLDVGAGHGRLSRRLAEHGYDVAALELDEALVGEHGGELRDAGVAFVRADGARLPWRSGTFDAAFLVEVFEHVAEPSAVLREISRSLRAGGRLWITVPTSYTERVYNRLHPRYAANAGHVRIYTQESLERLLAEAGFQMRTITPANFVPAVSWLFHALLRSESDHTGEISQHLWVDRVLRVLFGVWHRLPLLNRALDGLERRIGKSWYVLCEKTTALPAV